jgi:hypothetical protein
MFISKTRRQTEKGKVRGRVTPWYYWFISPKRLEDMGITPSVFKKKHKRRSGHGQTLHFIRLPDPAGCCRMSKLRSCPSGCWHGTHFWSLGGRWRSLPSDMMADMDWYGVSSKFKSQILTWTKQFMVQCAPAKSWYHGIIPHGGDSWIALPRKHPPQWHRGRCEHETKNMKLPSKMFSELSWREHLQESTINIHKSWERPWFPLNVPLNSCETNLLTYRLIIPAWFQPWHNCQQRCFQHVEETNCLGHNNCTYVFWK